MIETYWNEVFGSFKDENGKFTIPCLPEPLMSAHFGVQNIVGATEKTPFLSFKLCVFPPESGGFDSSIETEPLIQAIQDPAFWEAQQKLNPHAYEFIQRLLPFLATLPTEHVHFFLKVNGEIKASAIAGSSKCGSFLFNLAVDESLRQQGWGKKFFQRQRRYFFDRPTFFWTKHPWFILNSQSVDYHLVLSESAGK